jgi:hypothetical protein
MLTLAAIAPIVAVPSVAAASGECATVAIRATPHVNTASVPERITSTVLNCSTASETVAVVQTISGPTAVTNGRGARSWQVTIPAGGSVALIRHFAYNCCGTWRVVDTVSTTAGIELAHAARSFVMA